MVTFRLSGLPCASLCLGNKDCCVFALFSAFKSGRFFDLRLRCKKYTHCRQRREDQWVSLSCQLSEAWRISSSALVVRVLIISIQCPVLGKPIQSSADMKRNPSVLTIICLTVFGYIPPWSYSGIYCDDTSITFRYNGDSVTTVVLFVGLLIPSFLVVSLISTTYVSLLRDSVRK